MLDFRDYMTETEDILTKEYLNKVRMLIVSVIAALLVNAGVVALLHSITISQPRNAAPLFSVNVPPSHGPTISDPELGLPDHSIIRLFTSYSITLHTTFSPFPAPPNPGKLKRPLQHDHSQPTSYCFLCQATGFPQQYIFLGNEEGVSGPK